MGTAILPPRDCLHPETFKPRRSPNPNSGRSRRRRRSPVPRSDSNSKQPQSSRTEVPRLPAKGLTMGQVKILKRGEVLDPEPIVNSVDRDHGDDLVLSSTDRLGPEPETVQKQIKVSDLKVVDGIYAGSAAFFASPPPSSLPFPAFFVKGEKVRDAVATSDLRRLLRLDLL